MGAEELADRLSSIAEELGDLALERLRQVSAVSADGQREGPEAALVAEERRLTRARRAVEKAVSVLRTGGGAEP